MRVLHLIDHLGLGGSQVSLLDLVEARGAEVETVVWSLRDRVLGPTAERLRAAGVACRRLGLRKLPSLRSSLAAERPDVLHAHLDWSNTLGAAAALSLGERRPRVVCHLENDPAQHFALPARVMLRMLAPRVDAHVVVSESLGDAVRRAVGGRMRRLELIPPAIDLARFDPRRVDAAEALKLRAGASRVIGAVGRLADQKALEVLLEAAPRLLAADPGTRLLIVGDGPRRAALERRVRQLGLEAAVHFAGYRPDVEIAYRAMDVLALPSRHEGYAIVTMEAMAMGVPIVAARVVGCVNSVQDGVTGVLVPFGEAGVLAKVILRLFEDSEFRRRLIANASEWVRRERGRETTASRTEALYQDLLLGRAATGAGRPAGGRGHV